MSFVALKVFVCFYLCCVQFVRMHVYCIFLEYLYYDSHIENDMRTWK